MLGLTRLHSFIKVRQLLSELVQRFLLIVIECLALGYHLRLNSAIAFRHAAVQNFCILGQQGKLIAGRLQSFGVNRRYVPNDLLEAFVHLFQLPAPCCDRGLLTFANLRAGFLSLLTEHRNPLFQLVASLFAACALRLFNLGKLVLKRFRTAPHCGQSQCLAFF